MIEQNVKITMHRLPGNMMLIYRRERIPAEWGGFTWGELQGEIRPMTDDEMREGLEDIYPQAWA